MSRVRTPSPAPAPTVTGAPAASGIPCASSPRPPRRSAAPRHAGAGRQRAPNPPPRRLVNGHRRPRPPVGLGPRHVTPSVTGLTFKAPFVRVLFPHPDDGAADRDRRAFGPHPDHVVSPVTECPA